MKSFAAVWEEFDDVEFRAYEVEVEAGYEDQLGHVLHSR